MSTMELDAVVQVLLRHRVRIAAAAAAVGRDAHAADDVYQQVVLSALEHRDRFRDADHVLAWATKAARHRALDAARRKPVYTLPDEILDLIETPVAADCTDPAVDALHGCLGRLGGPARQLLQLKYDEGLTAPAIAVKLRRSADAVYQALSRTHRALRRCVERKLAADAARAQGVHP